LITPYKFKTKGELLSECRNKSLLAELIGDSTSCGKYGRYGLQHCGRCVPCMVRRSAFLKSGIPDTTKKGYVYSNLSTSGINNDSNDVGAMAIACIRINKFGIHHLIAGNLSFSDHTKRKEYEAIIERGFKEVETLFREQGVI